MPDYTIQLENFQGPLDLLLHLIRKAELDVTEVALARVTDQYLRHVGSIGTIDVEAAGEFLLVAATLLEIKSRVLDPVDDRPPPAVVRDDEDRASPGAELLQQLLAYRAYREAGDALESRLDEWGRRHPAGRGVVDPTALRSVAADAEALALDDVNLYDLIEAFRRVLDGIAIDRLGEHEIAADETPIQLHAEDVLDRLRREAGVPGGPSTPLRRLFEGRARVEAVGLFLAVLELCKQAFVRVRSDGDDVVLALTDAGWSGEASLDEETDNDEAEGRS